MVPVESCKQSIKICRPTRQNGGQTGCLAFTIHFRKMALLLLELVEFQVI